MSRMHKPAALLMLSSICACNRAAPPPTEPIAAQLSERWQSVRIPTSEGCGELSCLVGLSGVNRPTTVSVRLVSLAALKRDPFCRPPDLPRGIEYAPEVGNGWLSLAIDFAIPLRCSAFRPAGRLQPWRRSDSRNPFEAQNSFSYVFVPAGFSDDGGGQHIRCAFLYDPSGPPWDRAQSTLREAAKTCAVLFYFRRAAA